MTHPARSLLVAHWCVVFGLELLLQVAIASPRLSLLPADKHGWIRVQGEELGTDRLVTLFASSDLVNWKEIAVLHGGSFTFADPATTSMQQRFYRFDAVPLTASNDWKNQVTFPHDSFAEFRGAAQGWIKFAILTDDPTRVFYADSHRFTFHYDFATARIEPLVGLSLQEFERIAFFNAGRQVVLGALLFPGARNEYGIQFVSEDPLAPELVRDLFDLVKSTVAQGPDADAQVTAFYIPTFEQSESAHANRAYFESNGIPVSSAERWIGADVCYSSGWAVGTLKFFSATNVAAAYANGLLRPADILITDGIPAELPYVAGIISLAATTPNSHVAILAQSYGVPFAFLVDEERRGDVLQLVNREVAFQTDLNPNFNGFCNVRVVPIDPPLESATQSYLADLRTGPAFEVVPKERYGSYTAPTTNLLPADIKYFGGKAANYGLLRRVISSNSLPAIAISFDLWDDFMSQTGGSRTLRQEISSRLARFTYPPDVGALQSELAGIREMIRNLTQFTPAQQRAITNALSVFDRHRNIRFRSSTNVEDAESFTGAGLYDSYSGCLADDQDGDNAGPSICDPTETGERGVFRAIRRVFASFYNDNAYLERLRLGVDENKVGMAILVHHSTPDDIEMANGVATGTWQRQYLSFDGRMVTQLGAVSVANPDGTAKPEEVYFSMRTNFPPNVQLLQSSSLVRLGESVMTWEADYLALADLLYKVGHGYGTMFSNEATLQLDIEYKKVQPGKLELKQVRRIPLASNWYTAPVVLNNPSVTFSAWHGYYDDIWMAHRLKSRWTLQNRSVAFTETNLAQGFYTELTIEHLNGTNVQTLSGPISSFSNYTHEAIADRSESTIGIVYDRWSMGTAAGIADFELVTQFNGYWSSPQAPFRELSDLAYYGLTLNVTFPEPLLIVNWDGQILYRAEAPTRLYPWRPEEPTDDFREAALVIPGTGTNVNVRSSYWLPAAAKGDDCRCPMLRMVETRIEGLTSEPIVLNGYWSQTFGDRHSNYAREFIFEPRLEAGLPSRQLSELAAANIALLYINENGADGPPILMIVGLDGILRRFGE